MIKTKSQFFYGIQIDQNNKFIDFREGSNPVQVAELTVGLYSPEQFAAEITIALNDIGDGTYVCIFDRINKTLTISSDIEFSLLVQSGSYALSGIWSIMGFSGSDKTGSMTYTGTSTCGKVYRPQFLLQNYYPTNKNKAPIEYALNTTGSGRRELIRFGTEQLMECMIHYITDLYQPVGGPIENNPTAISDALDFMEFVTSGGNVEFMENRAQPLTYEILQLKSTPESEVGLAYKLEEMVDMNLQNYYRISKLTFRKIS